MFLNKHAANAPNSILRNALASFWTTSLTPFNNQPESSRDLTMLVMYSISSFDIIDVVDKGWLWEAEDEEPFPDPTIFLSIHTSAADAAAVNPEELKRF